ncbi:MAG: amino acid-binding protein [Blautia sp.]|jgi:hypothetical protein
MLKQLAVFVENKPGSLKKITAMIRDTQVNIYAFVSFDNPEFSIFRMVVDQPEEVKSYLTSKGCVAKVCDVIAIELEDHSGGLDRVLEALSESNISINYTYSSFCRGNQRAVVIIHSEEIYETEEILTRKGFTVLTNVGELSQ